MPIKKIKSKTSMKKATSSKPIKKSVVQKQKKSVVAKTKNRKPVPVAPKKTAPKPSKAASLSGREAKIQRIKNILLQQREALLNEAEVALNELPGQATFPDMGDQASAETDMNFMLRLRGREQRLLKKIDEAIERIDKGTFGICDDCGNDIELKRLEARPVTTMCIECKTLQEEEEKRREV